MARDMRVGIEPKKKIHKCCGPKEKNLTKYLWLGYTANLRIKKPDAKKEATEPECPGGNCEPHIITVEDILAASGIDPEETGAEMIKSLFEPSLPEEGHIRCCEECGEGLCRDGRKKEMRVGIDHTRD